MLFDFEQFSRIVRQFYPEEDDLYSPEDALEVFRCYFEGYELLMGQAHPRIKTYQIQRIVRAMPWITIPHTGEEFEIPWDYYPYMIEKHFATEYRNCDYNINHFFSGRVRGLRYLETCY